MKRFWPSLFALFVPAFVVAQTLPADLPVYRGYKANPVVTVDQSGNYVAGAGGGGYTGATATAPGTNGATATPIQGIAGAVAVPVSGTFWQATQPVSIASMPSTPVTGTFWQATQPVSIASMPSTPVTGTFWQATQPVSIATNTPSEAVSAAAGGIASSSYLASAAASTNATSVKASAGRLYKVCGYNGSASLRYLKLYNKASAPTVGTDTPLFRRPLPPGGFCFDWMDIGAYFATGIAYALTTGNTDADTGALTAADIVALSLEYN